MSIKSMLPSLWSDDDKNEDLFTSLHKEIDRVFDTVALPMRRTGLMREGALAMRVDVSESETDIKITAELPGVKQEDLRVELVGNTLSISGEKKSEQVEDKEEQGRRYHRVERSYGSFHRSLMLPQGVAADAVDASFKDGVLSVIVRKPPELQAASRKIEVKAA